MRTRWIRIPILNTEDRNEFMHRAGIFKKSMGARHRGGIGFLYRPARLHRLGGIHSLESMPGPHKHLKVRALGPECHKSTDKLVV
jgi:hypothetical protein